MRSGSTGADGGVRATGKRAAVVAGLLTLLVAAALGIALRSTVHEWWLVRRLESGEPDEMTIKTLGEMGSVRAIPRLLEIAMSVDFDLAWRFANTTKDGAPEDVNLLWAPCAYVAFQALCEVTARSGIRASRPLLYGLESPEARIRALALQLLGRSGIEPGLFAERAVLALNDSEDEVKGAAIEEVKRLGTAAVLPLWRALEKPSFEFNPEVEFVLSDLGQDARPLAPVFVGRFEFESNKLQPEIFDALESVGGWSLAVARLFAVALANEDEDGADGASSALQPRFWWGRRHAVGVLRETLTSTTAETRRRAIVTLAELHDDARSAAPDLMSRLRDQDSEVRMAAARALLYVGANGDEVVAALTEALHDPVAGVRSNALLSLLNLHETNSIPVSEVEARLHDESVSVRRMAANLFLKVCGADPFVLPAGIEGLGSDSWRREAAILVARMGPMAREAAPYLADHVHDPNSSLEVLKALLALGPEAAAAAPALLEALDTDDAERFGLASEALVRAAPHSVQFLCILREALRGPEPWIRPLAAAALWRLGQDRVEAMEVLTRGLRDSENRIRFAAVAGLVSMGREIAPRLLAEVLDPASPARAAAALALGRLGAAEPAVIEALGLLAQDPRSEAADTALNAVIALDTDPTGPLLQALQSSDRARRSFALQRIQDRGPRSLEFKRPLEKILSDPEPKDRASAAMILLQIDPVHESAARVLARAAAEEGRDGEPHGQFSRELTELASTSRAAVEALLAFYRWSSESPLACYGLVPNDDGQAPFVAPLAAALASKDEPTRYIASCLLRDSGPAGEPAGPALIACLDDASARVRVRAALTLGAIGPAAAPLAAAALTRQLARRQDPLLRASVLGALGDLGAGARDALPTLLAIVGDAAEEATLRCLALEAAVCVGGESAIEPELRALVDRGPGVLRRYAELLRVGVRQ